MPLRFVCLIVSSIVSLASYSVIVITLPTTEQSLFLLNWVVTDEVSSLESSIAGPSALNVTDLAISSTLTMLNT